MNIENDLRQIELKLRKKAFLSFHQDGIIDILIGWDVIGVGLFLHTHSPVYGFLGLAALFFYLPLKMLITLPRLGHAQFRSKPTPSMWITGSIGAVLLIAAIVYGFYLNSSLGPVALRKPKLHPSYLRDTPAPSASAFDRDFDLDKGRRCCRANQGTRP